MEHLTQFGLFNEDFTKGWFYNIVKMEYAANSCWVLEYKK